MTTSKKKFNQDIPTNSTHYLRSSGKGTATGLSENFLPGREGKCY